MYNLFNTTDNNFINSERSIIMVTKEQYGKMSKRAAPSSAVVRNTALAYITGGLICILGQGIFDLLSAYGIEETAAKTWTSVILIVLSALLTGLGLYEKLAKHAGAGTLVPITGFSNAVSSSAVEAKTEGFVLGVGAKIFTIAGPVILYGTAAGVVYGIIYYIGTHI